MIEPSWHTHEDDKETPLPCTDKLVFDTKKQANAAGIVANYQHGASVKAYHCMHCKLWHLASHYTVDNE